MGAEAPSAPPESAFNFFYDRAVAAYQEGRYAAAIDDLLIAYKMQPEPRLLFNIAQSHRKLGESAKAKQYFMEYLKADKDIAAEKKAEIERYLADLHSPPPSLTAPVAKAPPVAETHPVAEMQPRSSRLPLWSKALGSLLIVGGVGVAIPGITFLALDGTCTAPPVPPAIQCDRIYQLFDAGVAQTAVGSGLVLAGTLTLVIPYALSAKARSASTR